MNQTQDLHKTLQMGKQRDPFLDRGPQRLPGPGSRGHRIARDLLPGQWFLPHSHPQGKPVLGASAIKFSNIEVWGVCKTLWSFCSAAKSLSSGGLLSQRPSWVRLHVKTVLPINRVEDVKAIVIILQQSLPSAWCTRGLVPKNGCRFLQNLGDQSKSNQGGNTLSVL